jgi:hypothetical protein
MSILTVKDRLRPDLRIHLAAAEAEFSVARFLPHLHALGSAGHVH